MGPLIVNGTNITSSDVFGNTGKYRFPNELPYGGLKLYLSAETYRGGPYWTDLAQNIEFEAKNTADPYNTTQTPRTSIGGVPCIDFNNTAYWQSTQAGADLVDMRYDFTLVMTYYHEGISERDTIFEKAGNSYQSYQQELACTIEPGNHMSYYRGYNGGYDYANTMSYTTSSWNMIAIFSTGTNSRTGGYFNGSGWVSSYTSRSNDYIVKAGPIRLGYGYAGVVEAGYIHSCLVWNRKLSDEEINGVHNYFNTVIPTLNP